MQQRRPTVLLVVTAILVALAVYVVLPTPGLHFTLGSTTIDNPLEIRQGLDLRGGLQILLEADVPASTVIEAANMRVAKEIVENRVNALGLTEPLVQVSGDRRILVELPGITDPEQAIATLKETGLLEFVDMGNTPPPAGTVLNTDCLDPSKVDCGNPTGLTPTPAPTATSAVTSTTDITATATTTPTTPTGPTYHTIMTGVAIANATVSTVNGQVTINFTLTGDGARIFGAHTSTHVNQYLAIVLDKTVISAPSINGAITSGSGTITGNFTLASANQLALQLRYGSLPVPLKVVQ